MSTEFNTPGSILAELAACLLPPPPSQYPDLIAAFAKHPGVDSTDRGVAMISKQLGLRGVPQEQVQTTITDYLELRAKPAAKTPIKQTAPHS